MTAGRPVNRLSGTALPLRGNDIDTDRIVPARFLKEVTFSRMGEYPFFDERFDAEGKPKLHAFNDPRYQGASVLLVNRNFGCGSSREHAPQAINRFGLQAVVGESFAAIFAGNCLAIGLPAVTIAPDEMAQLQDLVEEDPSVPFTVDLNAMVIRLPDRTIPCEMPDATRKALLEGNWDTTTMLAKNLAKVRQLADRLPYVGSFTE